MALPLSPSAGTLLTCSARRWTSSPSFQGRERLVVGQDVDRPQVEGDRGGPGVPDEHHRPVQRRPDSQLEEHVRVVARQVGENQVRLLQVPDDLGVDERGAQRLRRDGGVARLLQRRGEEVRQHVAEVVGVAEVVPVRSGGGDGHGDEARLALAAAWVCHGGQHTLRPLRGVPSPGP
jgi:hypothetical protein